ncbi:MAG TPA: hypothetical protein PK402_05355 [Tepidisphaeraceae bacterium]|nr:hypothetical protein [Tepidisphaeraceae bacterium]
MATLALIRDLLFASKVTSTARAISADVTIVRDVKKLDEFEGDRLIVDLNAPGHLEAAAAWKARTGRPVIGFIAHVATDQIQQARELGIDRILSNGGFSNSIESILKNE